METTLDIRKKIHEFIDQADERILRIINAIIVTDEETEQISSDSFYEELDKRKERYLKGESKTSTWEEVKTKARAAVK